MSPTDDHPDDSLPTLDDRRFDLLVDGELPERERRNLLSTLDDLPGGWRRCALAFLEALSWKDELGGIRREADSPVQVAPARRRSGFPAGRWTTVLSAAASFLVALGLGLMIGDFWRPEAEGAPSPAQIAGAPQGPERPAPARDEPRAAPAADVPGDSWQLVTLPAGLGPDGVGPIQLPARQRDHLEEAWPQEFASTVPPDLMRLLKESGHEVSRDRRLVPFQLDDGRRVVVPFEQVEFRYVGNPAYQ
ncbi:MAG: hypothetical protein ABIK89_22615 [Planctomycetota bacterium]